MIKLTRRHTLLICVLSTLSLSCIKETAIDITYLDVALTEIAKMPPEELHEDNQVAADLLESAVRDRVRGMSPEEALGVIKRSAAAIRARGESTGSQADAYASRFPARPHHVCQPRRPRDPGT